MPQRQLAQVLSGFTAGVDERLLVGPSTVDDAGVVLLGRAEGLPAGSALALVQTVDFFPPVVDDPYFYGAIAAANALSDVYAMGGKPLSVLNLAGFPKDFSPDWMREIFRGGFDKVRESGAVVAGGHTVQTAEALFGFAVTGLVDPERVAVNSGAKVGDALYLTKPIGMGSMTTAAKRQAISWNDMKPAAEQMATLNAAAAEAMRAAGFHACTDVTGYGLVGHAHNVAAASGVTLRIELARVPLFAGARGLAAKGHLSGGAKRGRAALADTVRVAGRLDEALVNLAFDAETSGGLLIVLAPQDAPALERELAARSLPVHRIGECAARGDATIELV